MSSSGHPLAQRRQIVQPIAAGTRQPRFTFRFAALCGVLFVYAVVLGLAMDLEPYRVWAPLWVVPLLGAVGAPLLRRACRQESDRFVRRVFWIAWSIKPAAAIVNYTVQYIVYKGVVDASNFDRYGSALSDEWRSGHFTLQPLAGVAGGVGTHTLQVLTGAFYTVFGSSEITLFFVFSWMGFWGMYFFYRAAVITLPSLNRRRYAILIFFWPSLIFWSSALGKDCWSFFFLGLGSYGLARVVQRMPGGWWLLVVALAGITPVRADITLLLVSAAVVGCIVARLQRRRESPRIERFRGRDLVSLLALTGLIIGTLLAFKAFFHLSSISLSAFARVIHQASQGTDTGKSTFSGSISPTNVLIELFRPLPYQISSATAAVVSVEGLALLCLIVTAWPRLKSALRLALHNGYAAFCLCYAVLFLIAFSALSNSGDLDRERIQMLPMLFVMLSLARVPSRYERFAPRRMLRSGSASTREPVGAAAPSGS
jgi:hypothetical protein